MPTKSIGRARCLEVNDFGRHRLTSSVLRLNNCQRLYRVGLSELRPMAERLLHDLFAGRPYDIALSLVGTRVIALVNRRFLGHEGPTDVITFNYEEPAGPRVIRGEILICPGVAWTQSGIYGTTPGEELARYLVHGLLHLLGFEDGQAVERRAMKREEERWMARLRRSYPLATLLTRSRIS